MKHRAFGFTLIEVLVAVAITGFIMSIAYGGLNSVRRQSTQNEANMKRLRQVQLAMDIMTRDFSQLTPRTVRDGLGGFSPALAAGPDNVPPILFTRGGWANPLGSVRSTQERVAYSLEDGKLMRSYWPELDGMAQVVPQKQALLSDVTSLKVLYADTSGQFQVLWPVTSALLTTGTQTGNDTTLPAAVSITLTLKDLGDITRIVEVATPQ